MRRFGRFTDEKNNYGYWIPLAGVAGTMAAMQAQIQTLQVPSVHFAPSSANPNEYVTGIGGSSVIYKFFRQSQSRLRAVIHNCPWN
jgi:hypothetical protein